MKIPEKSIMIKIARPAPIALALSLVLGLLFAQAALGQDGRGKAKTPEKKIEDPLARIGVAGASVSSGFGLQISLADVLDKAVKAPHAVVNTSSAMFFTAPDRFGAEAVDLLEKEKVTAVIGLDFFFWYSYGVLGPEERFTLLKKGCALMERLKCPVIVGDIPDMRDAAGGMLLAEQVPSPEELRALNKQLRIWADGRDNVHIIPLSSWIDSLKNEKAITVGGKGRTFKKGELLQADQLHANEKGLALMVVKCLELLAQKCPAVDRRKLVLSYDAIAAQLMKEKKAAGNGAPREGKPVIKGTIKVGETQKEEPRKKEGGGI